MNKILNDIFSQHKFDFEKLIKYGFVFDDGKYLFDTAIADNQMLLNVKIDAYGNIETGVYDLDTKELYTLFLIEEASGIFVGKVRNDYQKVLCEIRDNCCDKTIFTTDYATKLIDYVQKTYGDNLEFLWEKSPTNAIWRRKDNQKWYCAILKVKANVLGLKQDNFVEVIDFRETPDTIIDILSDENFRHNKDYFPAYHMNKKYWLTIKLTDCKLPIKQIFAHIDNSYVLANKK